MNSLILHGKRFVQMQKCLNLRVSVNLYQNGSAFSNPFSSAIAADVSPRDGQKGKIFTVSYLVDSLGFTSKLSESISRKINFTDKANPDSVLKLLRSYGFSDSQISSIITNCPPLLILDAEKSLAPKLQFLQSRVASSSELTQIVSTVPKILGMRGDKTLSRYYDFAKEIVEPDKSSKYEKLCHSLPERSKQENKIRNVLVLRELGVPQKRLFPLLISYGAPVHGKEKFEESLNKVVDMGFDPTSANFVLALRVFSGMSDKTIEEKMELYERLGFAVGDVWEIFKKFPATLGISKKKIRNSIETFLELGFTRDEFALMVMSYPQCIGFSAESMKNKTEFLVKKMNWSLKAVVSNPSGLGYSLEKRTVPRCNVIKALMSKGLLGSKLPPMSSVLAITDKAFLNKYVMNHDDKQLVAKLIAIFTRNRVRTVSNV